VEAGQGWAEAGLSAALRFSRDDRLLWGRADGSARRVYRTGNGGTGVLHCVQDDGVGGFRNIEAFGITVLAPVPVGILFKSAHTRGGFGENIRIHDVILKHVSVALRITMNWNPSYSYAAIPAGNKDYPAYWTVLATPVPGAQGMAHFHDVHIWNMQGTARTAFEVDAFPTVTLDHITLDHIDLQTQTSGHIADVRDWTFKDLTLHS